MYSLLFLESISIECNYFFNYFSNLESILFVQNISLLLLIVSYRINSSFYSFIFFKCFYIFTGKGLSIIYLSVYLGRRQ